MIKLTNLSSSSRDGFGYALRLEGKRDKNLVVVSADLTESMRMHWFKDAYPERFVQVGVAEQNMVGVAAGLALGGKTVVAGSYAAFSPANSWGVIRTSLCYSDIKVVLVGGHAGLSIGSDGATHQSLEDIALMRVLPNMKVVVPADARQAAAALPALLKQSGPTYLRVTKYEAGELPATAEPFRLGKAQWLRQGEEIAIIACGTMVTTALKVADRLATIDRTVSVINMHTIKPLDKPAVTETARQHRLIVTLEEHQVSGGLGSAVAEVMAQSPSTTKFVRIGVQDSFGQSGSGEELLTEYGLDASAVFQTIIKHAP